MFHSEDYYDRKDPIGEPFLLLSDVEAYRAHSGFGLYPHIMTRSDGSIWGYRFNEASMDYPVMIKAPIGAESFTLGDVNLDGKVNTTDARLALRGAAIKQLPERTANKKKLGFPVPLNDCCVRISTTTRSRRRSRAILRRNSS